MINYDPASFKAAEGDPSVFSTATAQIVLSV